MEFVGGGQYWRHNRKGSSLSEVLLVTVVGGGGGAGSIWKTMVLPRKYIKWWNRCLSRSLSLDLTKYLCNLCQLYRREEKISFQWFLCNDKDYFGHYLKYFRPSFIMKMCLVMNDVLKYNKWEIVRWVVVLSCIRFGRWAEFHTITNV